MTAENCYETALAKVRRSGVTEEAETLNDGGKIAEY